MTLTTEALHDLVLQEKTVDTNTRLGQAAESHLERAWIALWCLHPDAGEHVGTVEQLNRQVSMLLKRPEGWVGQDPEVYALMAALG